MVTPKMYYIYFHLCQEQIHHNHSKKKITIDFISLTSTRITSRVNSILFTWKIIFHVQGEKTMTQT
jgi:hypothetical protein